MMGRVTQGSITSQLLRNINKNMAQSGRIQEQMSTGMKINRPSDDPVGITYSLRYRSDLSLNDRYQTNVDSATSFLDFNDTMLTQVNDVAERIKELAVQGSNGTNPGVALDNIASEMTQLKEQLVDIANSQFKGKYIFNGQFTDKKPYDPNNPVVALRDPAAVTTDSGVLDYTINTGTHLSVNLIGNDVFGSPSDSDNIFKVIDQMVANLGANNYAGVSGQIAQLESRMDKVLTQQAEIGARVNRVELMQQRLVELNINLEAQQSKVEDADFEELIIKSKVNESIYQASLSVGSKIIMPTLVDFLR